MDARLEFRPPANKPNPFAVLGVETGAETNDIVERGQDLMESADTTEQKLLYRWAMEQLITHPFARLGYELLELPQAEYEDREWERFARQYRSSPVELEGALRGCPAPSAADFDYARLIALLLDALEQMPAADVRVVLDGAPVEVDSGPTPLEIKDVIFG